MKMVKSLLLGSAAGLVAIAGAQAADLPVKAKPVQYVKICSLYGVGFYYIPGTDMCIKVGGWARFETAYGYNGSLTTEWYANNLNNRSTSDNPWRVKGTVTVDSRNQTEYGTVRSYVAVGISNSNVGDNPATGNYFNRWFIQWAGFTVGHATSFYDFYSVGANQFGYVGASSDTGDGGWDVAAYTAQFGNGLSASISAEVQRRTQIVAAGTVAGAGLGIGTYTVGTGYEGHDYPDVVANLRIDQAWGSAQVMGALHNVAAGYYGASEGTGHPSDKMGFAVGAGIKLNAPMIGPGDYFQAEVDYAQGASRYTNTTASTWNYTSYHGSNVGIGINSDAVYGGVVGATASDLQLTTSWAANAAYTHQWNKAWKTTLWGSYYAQKYNTLGNAMLCSAAGMGAGVGTTAVATAGCNMNWSMWGLGLRTQWNVTSDFYLGLEVLYSSLNGLDTPAGTIALTANGTKPAGTYTIQDQNIWAVRFRAHKDFYP
jgi:hypothetical protein